MKYGSSAPRPLVHAYRSDPRRIRDRRLRDAGAERNSGSNGRRAAPCGQERDDDEHHGDNVFLVFSNFSNEIDQRLSQRVPRSGKKRFFRSRHRDLGERSHEEERSGRFSSFLPFLLHSALRSSPHFCVERRRFPDKSFFGA